MSYHREAQYMANKIEIVKADPAKKEGGADNITVVCITR